LTGSRPTDVCTLDDLTHSVDADGTDDLGHFSSAESYAEIVRMSCGVGIAAYVTTDS